MNVFEFVNKYQQAMNARDRDGALALVSANRATARKAAHSILTSNWAVAQSPASLPAATNSLTVALNIAEQLEEKLLEAEVRKELSLCYLRTQQLHHALASARDAEQIYLEHGDEGAAGEVSQVSGRIFESFADDTERRRFLLRHLQYCKDYHLPKEYERTKGELA